MANFPSAFLMKGHKRRPPKRTPRPESFIAYLRRVAEDSDTAGRPMTADDYRAAASRLDFVEQAIMAAVITLEAHKRLSSEDSYALARLRDALTEIRSCP